MNITTPSSIEAAQAVWLSEDAIEGWKDQSPPQQGAQWIFTDLAIQTCLQIKVVYGLGLREAEGFVASLFELMGLEELPVPDYTTLSKRQGDLAARCVLVRDHEQNMVSD